MIRIHNMPAENAIEALLGMEFDAVITDPPYAPSVHEKAISCGTKGAPVNRDLGFASLTQSLRSAIATLVDHASRWSCVFSDIETAHLWRISTRVSEYVRTVPWVRWSQPQLSGDRPPSGCELVTIWHSKGKKHWNGPGSLTAFDAKCLRGKEKFSCEKPLDLMLSLVSWFSDFGELVVDPTCGSGTTGLACRILGRDAILIDSDERACERAQSKIDAPLSFRDRERCERWIEYQRAWLDVGPADTDAGRARYALAEEDTRMVEGALL